MSSEQILSNPIIIQELVAKLEPDYPDDGLTSIVNTDNNLNISVSNRHATINFENTINIDNLNVTGIVDLDNFVNPWVSHEPISNGQVLSSATNGNLSWTSNGEGGLTFLNTFTTVGPSSADIGSTITVFDQTLTGLTIGKKLIMKFGFSTFYSYSSANVSPIQISLVVDGTTYQSVTGRISSIINGIVNYSFFFYGSNFVRVNTATSHHIQLVITVTDTPYQIVWNNQVYSTALFFQG